MTLPGDRPCPARPILETLPRAVSTFISHEEPGDRLLLKLDRWANAYGTTPEQVKAEFDHQDQVNSLTPSDGEGK